jgi:ubiquinone/menaquinone biosynthesis C-methylase UbiE
MKRVVTAEILDTDSAPAPEVQRTLADLRRINRWFGGISTTRRLLTRVFDRTRQASFTLLDVGAGSGDVSTTAARQLRNRAQVDVTLLDRMASHLPRNGERKVSGDALALPFRDGSFDLVTSSLFIHHLEADEIVGFINEALRVARIAVLLNDLRREPIHLALMYAGHPIFGRITMHDGIASVRRAYTPRELHAILQQTAACGVEIENRYLFRMGVVVWKS